MFTCKICKENTKHFAKGFCQKCYMKNRPREICCICGSYEHVEKREEKGSVCRKCFSKFYKKIGKCFYCNQIKKIAMVSSDGMVCSTCRDKNIYKRRVTKCDSCEKNRKVHLKNENGNFCQTCYNKLYRKKEKCDSCGKMKIISKRQENLCDSCRNRIRYKTDSYFRTKKNLRVLIRKSFFLYSKIGKIKTIKKYDIDIEKIILHLTPFPENVEEYHIDHIFPLSAFNLDDSIHIKAAFAPENHQWLKKEENLKKSNKYNECDFLDYLDRFKS